MSSGAAFVPITRGDDGLAVVAAPVRAVLRGDGRLDALVELLVRLRGSRGSEIAPINNAHRVELEALGEGEARLLRAARAAHGAVGLAAARVVATALGAQPEGTYAAITELDVRFFAGVPIADLVDDALERCGDGCDGVFQREDDTSLHRNLGFMVIKVDRRVKKLFEHVGLAAATSGRVPGREKRATFPRPLSRPFPTRFG